MFRVDEDEVKENKSGKSPLNTAISSDVEIEIDQKETTDLALEILPEFKSVGIIREHIADRTDLSDYLEPERFNLSLNEPLKLLKGLTLGGLMLGGGLAWLVGILLFSLGFPLNICVPMIAIGGAAFVVPPLYHLSKCNRSSVSIEVMGGEKLAELPEVERQTVEREAKASAIELTSNEPLREIYRKFKTGTPAFHFEKQKTCIHKVSEALNQFGIHVKTPMHRTILEYVPFNSKAIDEVNKELVEATTTTSLAR